MTDGADQSAPAPGIVVRYIYSACVVMTTPDVRVLNDPWFTEGVYDGSWFHYPEVIDPIGSIGDVDIIYVSHIHPDHFDPLFLRDYFAEYGVKEIIIADHVPNHLAAKMRGDGFKPTVLAGPRSIGQTRLEIVPHRTGSKFDIDSALIVKFQNGGRTHCVVNANDIVFEDSMLEVLKDRAGDTDILLCGYTGAGPFPQTYYELDDPQLPALADQKRRSFFDRYRRLTGVMSAKVNIPFAGKYLLGGRLVPLNDYRGVADATEILAFDPNAVVLADNGGEVSTAGLRPTHVRTQRYEVADIRRRERELAGCRMDYERLINAEEIHQLPIKRLLAAAARRACKESECETDYFFLIHVPGGELGVVNANRNAEPAVRYVKDAAAISTPKSEIRTDPRYLFGLLTGVYHWNNAEVGSQIATRRTPNELNRKAQSFLTYLRV
jgi:UDP-MurNAc hydroxylase